MVEISQDITGPQMVRLDNGDVLLVLTRRLTPDVARMVGGTLDRMADPAPHSKGKAA